VSQDAGQTGAKILQVLPESPAATAGLKEGDVVLAIGDKPVATFEDLANSVRTKEAGEEVEMTVLRDGKEEKMTVKLGAMPEIAQPGQFPFGGQGFRVPTFNQPGGMNIPMPPAIQRYFSGENLGGEKRPMIGVQLQPLNDALRERLGLGEVKGVVVTDVVPDSPAAKAELESTDVLLEVNGKPIEDPQMLAETVGSAKAGDEITLKVRRGEETMDKKLVIEEMAAGPRFGNFGNNAAEFAESVIIPRVKVAEMQKKIDDLEAKVSELTKQIDELKAEKAGSK
jgi:serine protease Do